VLIENLVKEFCLPNALATKLERTEKIMNVTVGSG